MGARIMTAINSMKAYPNGRTLEEAFYDVRTVLSADEIGDSQWSMLEQGRAATHAGIEWFASKDPPCEKELAERIPYLAPREDCYPLRQINQEKTP
jgi:hypothetical protein